MSQDSKREVSTRDTCGRFGAVAATLLYVAWFPHGSALRITATPWASITALWILNSHAALQAHPYWYIKGYVIMCFHSSNPSEEKSNGK